MPTDFRSLSCPPIGALPRNRLASSATGSASPISPTPRLLHSLKRFRRARCPHPAARCPLCPLQKNVSLRSQCAHWLWQSVIPLRPPMPTAGHFLPTAARSTQRTPPKPIFLESFRAWNTYRKETLLPRVPIAPVHRLAFVSSLPLHTTRKRPILLVTDATPALQKSL